MPLTNLTVFAWRGHELDHLDHPLPAHCGQTFLGGPKRHDHVLHRVAPQYSDRAVSRCSRSRRAVLYIRDESGARRPAARGGYARAASFSEETYAAAATAAVVPSPTAVAICLVS